MTNIQFPTTSQTRFIDSVVHRLAPTLAFFSAVAITMLVQASGLAQESEGLDALNRAFDKKVSATSTRDLDEVAKLCEQAIAKGLAEDEEEQARMLATTAYFEHADRLAERILTVDKRIDPRWATMRREALRRLEKSIKMDPEMAEAYVLIGRLNGLPRGDRKKGKEAIETAIDLIEDDDQLLSDALVARAMLSGNLESDESKEFLDKAIDRNPDNKQALSLRSQIAMKSGDVESALNDLDHLLELANNPDAYTAQATLLTTNRKFAESEIMQQAALRYFDKAIEAKPEIRLFLSKAVVFQAMKKPEDAIAAIDKAIELEPKSSRPYLLRSAIHADEQDYDQAIEDLNGAIKADPDDKTPYRTRIRLYLLKEDNEAAAEACRELLKDEPDDYGLLSQLTAILLSDDRPNAGIDVITKAIELTDDTDWESEQLGAALPKGFQRLDALRLRGDCYLNAGRHAEAIEDYELAVEMNDIISDLLEGAPRSLPNAVFEEQKSREASLLNNFAWVLATSPKADLRDGERSIKLGRRAAKLTNFKRPHILSTLASGYAETGDFKEAKEWIKKAIEANEDDARLIDENKSLDDDARQQAEEQIAEQLESLESELDSYRQEKPWRELQLSKKEPAAESALKPEDSDSSDESETADTKGTEDKESEDKESEEDEKEEK